MALDCKHPIACYDQITFALRRRECYPGAASDNRAYEEPWGTAVSVEKGDPDDLPGGTIARNSQEGLLRSAGDQCRATSDSRAIHLRAAGQKHIRRRQAIEFTLVLIPK